jgi:hypothetical protein
MALVIIATLVAAGCMCGERQLTQSESPDGKYIATFFERDCGATSGYVRHVNLKERGSWVLPSLEGYQEEGQVFVGDGRKVDLIWNGNKALLIKCEECSADSRVYLQSSWRDVSISYQPGQKAN